MFMFSTDLICVQWKAVNIFYNRVMELKFGSLDNHLKKFFFNVTNDRSDGLILQVHPSHTDSRGETKKYRFTQASFSSNGSHLALSDHKGNIFTISLEMERYWLLPHFGVSTVISFPVLKNHELLVGLDNTTILLIHIETGKVMDTLQGHSVPPTEVSYSDDGYYYLTSCTAEAIVWDSSTNTQIHRLSLKLEVSLKKAVFMPVSNHILACFQDDTMHIWKFKSFECIKQIVPETWRTHHLRAIAITRNGRAMVIGGHGPCLIIFCLDTWAVRNVVDCPEGVSGVKQLEFLSQVFDGGANKILVMLTMSQDLIFLDVETLVFFKWIHQSDSSTVKFLLSNNGKYLANILTNGEVNIYTVEKVLPKQSCSGNEEERCSWKQNPSSRNNSSSSRRTQKSYESLSDIQKEIKTVLDLKRLLPILKQFGEYPQSYRTTIWKMLLKLPENKESFVSLSVKKCHPSYSKLELKYPLANKSLGNILKKVLSIVSHWCPLFGEVDFLPEFVFPFVKLFHSSPLVCFEVVATVIVNWCQNWFEFYPFPPINMLSVLESILGYHDPGLLQFYLANNVTSSITVCPLFHTAFSEVLSKPEWLKLWDHVLSNEPSFLFMVIVAYNVVCQKAIRSLKGSAEIEKFFRSQNPVDLKAVINKAYFYLKKTPEDIHTRQFFSPFRSLGASGIYVPFLAYPRLIVDASTEKLQCIRQEEEKILDEQLQALAMRKTLENKQHNDSTYRDKERLYRELEDRMRQTVEEEEDRLLAQRRKLRTLRQELRLKELQVLEATRNKTLEEKIRRKESEFERLLKDVSKRRLREKDEVDLVEDEIRSYYSNLLLRKRELELALGALEDGNVEGDAQRNLEEKREKLKSDLTESCLQLQYEWDGLHHSRNLDLCNKITTIKDLISKVESELAKEITNDGKNSSENKKVFMQELKNKVELLEEEVELLIRKNLEKLRNEEDQRRTRTASPRRNNNENSNSKWKIKNEGTSKSRASRRTVKYVNNDPHPGGPSGVRKITTIRTRGPQRAQCPAQPPRTQDDRPPHPRTKFTCPGDPRSPALDSADSREPLDLSGNEESRQGKRDWENEEFGGRKLHQRPWGDHSCAVEKGKLSKYTAKRANSYSMGNIKK